MPPRERAIDEGSLPPVASLSDAAWRAPSTRGWACIFGIWALVGLFNSEQTYITLSISSRPTPFLRVLGVMAPGMALWALLTPMIMWLAVRVRLDRGGVPVHVGAALLAAAADATLYHLIDPWVNPFGTRPLIVGFVRYISVNVANYIGVVAVTLVMRYSTLLRERQVAAAELRSQLVTAHLCSLQAQLRPHFLFNTLNMVAELVHRDPERADRVIVRLGALLRRSFDTLGTQEIALATELDFLRDYADIVCARFPGRTRITMDVDPFALQASVPSLLLQPLVENAVRHGLEPRVGGGEVEVVARLGPDRLELEVRDDGCGLPPGYDGDSGSGAGVGLRNTAARLRHLYGDAHRFSVRSRVTGGTVVAIQIPFRRAASAPPARGGTLRAPALEVPR